MTSLPFIHLHTFHMKLSSMYLSPSTSEETSDAVCVDEESLERRHVSRSCRNSPNESYMCRFDMEYIIILNIHETREANNQKHQNKWYGFYHKKNRNCSIPYPMSDTSTHCIFSEIFFSEQQFIKSSASHEKSNQHVQGGTCTRWAPSPVITLGIRSPSENGNGT